jgi:hypothetical protein
METAVLAMIAGVQLLLAVLCVYALRNRRDVRLSFKSPLRLFTIEFETGRPLPPDKGIPCGDKKEAR